jgi:tRNA (guanine-N7-)-methyltransferase
MGRRALPKIDPAIEFEDFLSRVDELDENFSVDELFGRSAPLEIEVGSGKGLFLQNASRANPEVNYLGNEAAHKYARFCAYRFAKYGCQNARMIAGDGLKLFRDFLSDESARAVHVYFPDPWWKASHRRRRVMTPGFVADFQRVLEPGGVFHFWTDVEEYFEATIELMATESDLSPPIMVDAVEAAHDMDYRTHFERRMRLHDHPVFRAKFQKGE